jgi:hypothetical protein
MQMLRAPAARGARNKDGPLDPSVPIGRANFEATQMQIIPKVGQLYWATYHENKNVQAHKTNTKDLQYQGEVRIWTVLVAFERPDRNVSLTY